MASLTQKTEYRRKLRNAKGEELKEARALMEKYNKQDVLLTEELYGLMLPWVTGMNLPAFNRDDRVGPLCPNCESDNVQYRGFQVSTSRRYRRFHHRRRRRRCPPCSGRRRQSSIRTRRALRSLRSQGPPSTSSYASCCR